MSISALPEMLLGFRHGWLFKRYGDAERSAVAVTDPRQTKHQPHLLSLYRFDVELLLPAGAALLGLGELIAERCARAFQ